MEKYRIREEVILMGRGCSNRYMHAYIAERKTKFLYFFKIWVPVLNAEWRTELIRAREDIDDDVNLRRKLTDPIIIEANT